MFIQPSGGKDGCQNFSNNLRSSFILTLHVIFIEEFLTNQSLQRKAKSHNKHEGFVLS
jgi:hypothetical protein